MLHEKCTRFQPLRSVQVFLVYYLCWICVLGNIKFPTCSSFPVQKVTFKDPQTPGTLLGRTPNTAFHLGRTENPYVVVNLAESLCSNHIISSLSLLLKPPSWLNYNMQSSESWINFHIYWLILRHNSGWEPEYFHIIILS